MRVNKGGTSMYCPSCNDITICKAIPAAKVTGNAADYAQRMYYLKHKDINLFQRGRECQSCWHKFVSAEAPLAFLDELIELRNALSTIKSNAEAYVNESAVVSASLLLSSMSLWMSCARSKSTRTHRTNFDRLLSRNH